MEGVDSKIGKMGFKKHSMLAPGWLRGLSFCLWLRLWSQGPGTEPHIGLPALLGGLLLPLLLPLLSLPPEQGA